MDSVSQFVLGSSVCAVALGSRVPAVRAVLWGGLVATLPDLDILIEHGDAIQNMTRHRAESHSLFWLTIVSPLVAFGIAALHRERGLFRRWWLAVWLALFTHPLLDALTVYGTQLWLPFSDQPVGIGCLFVVDPLYTLPLLVGSLSLLVGRGGPKSRRWNVAGILLSTAYAAWSLLAWQHVHGVAVRSLRAAGIESERIVVGPAPFQTLLWRIVALTPDVAYEGVYSMLDEAASMSFDAIDRGPELLRRLSGDAGVDRLTWFSSGFIKAQRIGDEVRISDLRMGAEPDYVFTFPVARFDGHGELQPVEHPTRLPFRFDAERGLPWLWRRIWDERAAPRR